MLLTALVAITAGHASSHLYADDPVIQWIRSRAHPLETALAESGFKDMEAFREIVGSARVVSMGEATHGSREVNQMKHRMLEFLVKEKGFTTFAIEAPYVYCIPVNDYVLHGKGNIEEALKDQGVLVGGTEEMQALVEWMRKYNANPKTKRKVSFAGFDLGSPRINGQFSLRYLRETLPEAADRFQPLIDKLPQYASAEELLSMPLEEMAGHVKTATSFKAVFERNAGVLSRMLGPERYADALQCAVVTEQAIVNFNMLRNYPLVFLNGTEAATVDGKRYSSGFDQSFDYLRALAPKLPLEPSKDLKDLLDGFANIKNLVFTYFTYYKPEDRELIQQRVKKVLSDSEQTIATAEDRETTRKALVDLAALLPFLDKYAVRDGEASKNLLYYRDECLSKNALRLLERGGPQAGLMTWAHNGHVEKGSGTRTLGGAITKALGSRHLVVGFSVNRGSLQAFARPGSEAAQKYGPGIKGFYFAPSPVGSLDHTLSQTGIRSFFVDLRDPKDERVASWLDKPQVTRYVDSVFDPFCDSISFRQLAPRKSFDVIIFMNETTRAIPNRKQREAFRVADLTPVNPKPPGY